MAIHDGNWNAGDKAVNQDETLEDVLTGVENAVFKALHFSHRHQDTSGPNTGLIMILCGQLLGHLQARNIELRQRNKRERIENLL